MTNIILDTLTGESHTTGTLAICIKGLCKTIEQLEQRVSWLEATSHDFIEMGLVDEIDPSLPIVVPDWTKNLPDASERAKQMLDEEKQLQKTVSIDEEVKHIQDDLQKEVEYGHYVRHGGVLVDVFEHVADASVLIHEMDLARADWETRADEWFEVIEFDEDEYDVLKTWLASSLLSRSNTELTAFIEREVKVYARKEGVVRVYIDQFSIYVSPVGEPFVRITVYISRDK